MPAPTIAIAPQDELLRLTGTTGNPLEDVTATGNGTGRYFGANKQFNVRPIVAGVVSGTNPTLDVKLQVSADGVTYTDTGGISLAQLTASSAAANLSLTVPPLYVFNTPSGFPYVRRVNTIGGTNSPTFLSFWLAIEPSVGF